MLFKKTKNSTSELINKQHFCNNKISSPTSFKDKYFDIKSHIPIYQIKENISNFNSEINDKSFGLIIEDFCENQLNQLFNLIKIANSNFSNLVYLKIVNSKINNQLIKDLFQLLMYSRILILDIIGLGLSENNLKNLQIENFIKQKIVFKANYHSQVISISDLDYLSKNNIIEVRCNEISTRSNLVENLKKSHLLNTIRAMSNEDKCQNKINYDCSLSLIDQQLNITNEEVELIEKKHSSFCDDEYKKYFGYNISRKFENLTPNFRLDIIKNYK